MDFLCECSTDRDRREALQKLPPDLPSSYERILERVNRSTIQNQRLVMKTLQWLAHAKEPLTTKKLLQALAIREDQIDFDSDGMPTEDELLHWCSSLVRRSTSFEGLEFAHFTVKEFLLEIVPDHLRAYLLTHDHTSLATDCMIFLKSRKFDQNSTLILNQGDRDIEGKWSFFLIPTHSYIMLVSTGSFMSIKAIGSQWTRRSMTSLRIFHATEGVSGRSATLFIVGHYLKLTILP